MTTVPEHWIPLVPVATSLPATGQPVMALERRALQRTRPDGRYDTAEPPNQGA